MITKLSLAEKLFHCSETCPQLSWENLSPAELGEFVCDSDLTKQARTMEWGGGDLSLIKGVIVQGEDPRKQRNQRSRRVLKHMRYDERSGHFMPIESRRKQNCMMVRYKVDDANHRVLPYGRHAEA